MKAIRRLALYASVAASAMTVATIASAQETSSAMRVRVIDPSGEAVANVSVTIIHTPTGRTTTRATSAGGILLARGLPVGGPYVIQLTDDARKVDYALQTYDNVFLKLGETENITLLANAEGAATVEIEELTVTANRVLSALRQGAAENFNEGDINAIAAISRDFVSVLETDSKIFVDSTIQRGPGVSVAGQNFRYNSVTIDGVPQNDNFGLSFNASATQRSPISLDAIGQVQVNIAPFDVTYGNFLGGNINIVTKSGTNEFHGGAFYFHSADELTGDNSGSEDLVIPPFTEKTYGGTLGGPIVKDKLFFFANYERFETTFQDSTALVNIPGVSQAQVDQARQIARDTYGFDSLGFNDPVGVTDEKYLIKLDWNINDRHRAQVAYQHAKGNNPFDDFSRAETNVAALNSARYDIREKLDSYSVQVFSDWTDNFSTEVKFGLKDAQNRQTPFVDGTPAFNVTTPDGGTIKLGTDQFRHNNELDSKTYTYKVKADYLVGDHTLTLGFEREENKIRNLFQPWSHGEYFFSSFDDLANRNPNTVFYGNAFTGNPEDAAAQFQLTTNTVYLQDEWAPTDALTLTFGVRYDRANNGDDVPLQQGFVERNGFANTENLDGKDLFLPRFGFNWEATNRLTVRGGVGRFGGGSPLVWLANSYNGSGVLNQWPVVFSEFFITSASNSTEAERLAAIQQALAGSPNDTAAIEAFQQFLVPTTETGTNSFLPDFELLASWKYNLAFDYVADLSSIGLGDDWRFSVEAIYTDVDNGFDIVDLRREQTGTAPDGRPTYNSPPNFDLAIRNTSRGHSGIYSLKAEKEWDTDYGLFALDLGYSYQDVKEVNSASRFIHYESYSWDAGSDFNNRDVTNSIYEIPHRITANFTWEKELFGDNITRLNLFYTGRSGRNYSYTFGSGSGAFGGVFLADFGDELNNPGAQSFYVPTGVNDPLVTGDAGFLAALDGIIDNSSCLSSQRGQIAEANSCRTPWVNRVNMRLSQEVEVYKGHKLEFILDIENLGNLINSDWGRAEGYFQPANLALVTPTIENGQYVYSQGPGLVSDGAGGLQIAPPTIAPIPSVYKVQLGIRYRF